MLANWKSYRLCQMLLFPELLVLLFDVMLNCPSLSTTLRTW
jgi:hypothetical protein